MNGGGADTQVPNTNAAGVASVDFLSTSLSTNDTQGFLQSLVTASATGSNTVTFYITTGKLALLFTCWRLSQAHQ